MIENPNSNRLISIDAFRAVTLLLMIFVNDFWTLKEIPAWLGHSRADEDAMGFSDVIFPAFLFIVGLSIPVAIQNRLKKGSSLMATGGHILMRSLALLIIGFCHVNLGNYSSEALLPKPLWEFLITISFFLIWLDYSKDSGSKRPLVLQITGIILLSILLIIYKGDAPDGHIWMRPRWWGILGLIGWSYLLSSMVFLISKGKFKRQLLAFTFFLFFSIANHLGWLHALDGIRSYVWMVESGSLPALVMAGVITSMVYADSRQSAKKFWIFVPLAAILMIGFGLVTRPLWGISKILATPSWTAICIGISILAFAFFVYLTDLKGITAWYKWIKPAGVSTLTCFLLPYIHSAFLQTIDYRLPVELRTGAVGLTKSFLFSLLIIQIAALLEKRRVRLKI